MVYTGRGLEIYFGIESNWMDGTGFGNQHIPFNPMEDVPVPKAIYTQKEAQTAESLVPSLIWDEMLQEQEKEYSTIYKDPFLLLTLFDEKSVAGFGGGATGQISAAMGTGCDCKYDTLWIQSHIKDLACVNDIDKRLKGCEVISFELSVETGDLLREKAIIRSYDFDESLTVMNCSADFHGAEFTANGGYSEWNEKNANGVIFTAVKMKWGGTGFSDLGLASKSKKVKLDVPKESEHTSESLVASQHWEGNRRWTAEVQGTLVTDALILEAEKPLANKVKATIDFYIDADTGEEEYVRITNMFVEKVESDDISKASESKQATVTFRMYKDSVVSYSGKFAEQTDPTSKINKCP